MPRPTNKVSKHLEAVRSSKACVRALSKLKWAQLFMHQGLSYVGFKYASIEKRSKEEVHLSPCKMPTC